MVTPQTKVNVIGGPFDIGKLRVKSEFSWINFVLTPTVKIRNYLKKKLRMSSETRRNRSVSARQYDKRVIEGNRRFEECIQRM